MNSNIDRPMDNVLNDHVIIVGTQAAARRHTIAKDISCEHFFFSQLGVFFFSYDDDIY